MGALQLEPPSQVPQLPIATDTSKDECAYTPFWGNVYLYVRRSEASFGI